MTTWLDACEHFYPDMPPHIYAWLTKAHKITPNLKLVTSPVEIKVFEQSLLAPLSHEKMLSHDKQMFVREVFIHDNKVRLSFGRVCVPLETFNTFKDDFESLGKKPIGEAILYKRKDINRSVFKFTKLLKSDELYRRIAKDDSNPLPEALYARYSVFHIQDKPMMITEIIFPTIPEFPEYAFTN